MSQLGWFLVGLLTGGSIGVGVTSLLVVAADSDKHPTP